MTETEAQQRMSAQLPSAEKKARADYVIDTSGPKEDETLTGACACGAVGFEVTAAFDTVNNDDQLGATLVVNHLVATGRKRIAFLNLDLPDRGDLVVTGQREVGYRAAMTAAGLVKTYSDLYKLTKDDVLSLERQGDKSAQNIIDSIETSRRTTLARFIYALGIRFVG